MLGLGSKLTKQGIPVVSHVTDNLKMLHRYNTGEVIPVSDGAFYFNDSSINFGTGVTHNYSSGDTAHTYSFWVLRETSPIAHWEALMSKQGTSGYSWILFNSDPSAPKLYYETNTNGNYAWGTPPNMDTRWHHYVITANSATVEMYQDGVKMATTDTSIGDDHTIDCLGDSGAGSNYLRGYMCNVGIWERVLTQAEIKDIMFKNYEGLSSTNKTNLLHWWNLDEETNTSGESGTGGVKDSHGTNHGTLA